MSNCTRAIITLSSQKKKGITSPLAYLFSTLRLHGGSSDRHSSSAACIEGALLQMQIRELCCTLHALREGGSSIAPCRR